MLEMRMRFGVCAATSDAISGILCKEEKRFLSGVILYAARGHTVYSLGVRDPSRGDHRANVRGSRCRAEFFRSFANRAPPPECPGGVHSRSELDLRCQRLIHFFLVSTQIRLFLFWPPDWKVCLQEDVVSLGHQVRRDRRPGRRKDFAARQVRADLRDALRARGEEEVLKYKERGKTVHAFHLLCSVLLRTKGRAIAGETDSVATFFTLCEKARKRRFFAGVCALSGAGASRRRRATSARNEIPSP